MFVPFYNYGNVTPFVLTKLATNLVCPGSSPIFNYLAFGNIAENPVITPNSTTQVVRASAPNRVLNTVTVKAIPNTPTV